MDQIKRDLSEVILLESLNAQRIDRLNDSMTSLRDKLQKSIAHLATGVATQAQALAGFRELYGREITYIHQALSDVKESLSELKSIAGIDKDKLTAVEKDIAVTRGSIRGVVMSWSGFVALIAFVIDKAMEMIGRR